MLIEVKVDGFYKYINSSRISYVFVDDKDCNDGCAVKLIMSNGSIRVHSVYDTLNQARIGMDNLISLINKNRA